MLFAAMGGQSMVAGMYCTISMPIISAPARKAMAWPSPLRSAAAELK